MLWFEPGHYVRVKELADGPLPRPLESGFNTQIAYRVLGVYSPSETSETFLIMSNDRDEIWHISNRHVRLCPFARGRVALHLPLEEALEAGPKTGPKSFIRPSYSLQRERV
jgi:hypothetical protein